MLSRCWWCTSWCRARVDLSTLRSAWTTTHPKLKAEADRWNGNGIDDKILSQMRASGHRYVLHEVGLSLPAFWGPWVWARF
jgi:hypothetical protein